ncbi:heterokaryon incompatibility protein-domain-containing protein [Flammula alnicola]|nr:heterokaryon incompatibility protein-domain-containing protein [Flammula alnicola]
MSRRASAIKSLVFNSLSKLQPHARGGQSTEDTLPHSQENPDSPSTLVCAACRTGPFSYEGFRKAVFDFHDSDTGYCYTTTWHDISQSISNEGCNWCGLISRARDGLPAEKSPRAGEENVEIRVQVMVQSPVDWMDVTNTITVFLNGYKAATYKIYADPSDAAAKEIGTGNHIRKEKPYVDYDKAKECVKNCSDHDHCSKLDETYLPTRVIDCSDPSKPRLFETHRQIKGYYCTLSYVWGGEQHQKTTIANIDTYVREGINVPLPQTITDAIFATHKLGVRYLWVDALCIIQDSFEDKVKELANMGHVYRDSYLTISVLSAYRADEGFLPDERTSVMLPFHVAHRIKWSRSLGRMLLKYDIPRQDPSLGYKHQTVATHSPLDERGWCLQESILSPRRLVFQPPYVQYKCRSFSENLTPGQWEKETTYSQRDYILFPIAKDDSTSGGGVAEDELREQWEQILSSYTGCKITVPPINWSLWRVLLKYFNLYPKMIISLGCGGGHS